MTKSLRIAVLSAVLAVTITPAFADPTGTDPPPPPNQNQTSSMTATDVILAVLTSLGA
jgi:hypothetical protein